MTTTGGKKVPRSRSLLLSRALILLQLRACTCPATRLQTFTLFAVFLMNKGIPRRKRAGCFLLLTLDVTN